jgi:hypothetical protein
MPRRRLKLCSLLAVILAVLCTPAGASAAGWFRVASPNPVAITGQLFWVACSGPSACMAVGTRVTPTGVGVSVSERWNGSSWRSLSTPAPAGAEVSDLFGVSCPSSSSCYAVGAFIDAGGTQHAFAERWNGTTWSVASLPPLPGARGSKLNAVQCTSATACTAVGVYMNQAGMGLTLVERWDGSSWTVQPSRNVSGAQLSALSGVWCTSSSACVAVGFTDSGTLAERWNGSAWSIQPTPSPGNLAGLDGVSCSSAGGCTAVGNYQNSTGGSVNLAERWNGSAWTVQSTPNPTGAQNGFLNDVWCSSSADCIAVGASFDGSSTASTVVERWNGSAWRIVTSPGVSSGRGSLLLALACPAVSRCIATGYGSDKSNVLVTLAEGYNGTLWSVQPTVDANGAAGGALLGVACPTSSSCLAAGQATNGTLTEQWNGSRWQIVPSPNPAGAAGAGLNGIACPARRNCIAVGGAFDLAGNPAGTLAEQWNGTLWSIQPTPTSTSGGYIFWGVGCSSANACTAVGDTNTSVLAERWNGTAWKAQTISGPPGAQGSLLAGVSCPTLTACFAVGGAFDGSGNTTTLVEHWNGTAWSIQSTPTSGDMNYFLNGISCVSATNCTVAGNTATGTALLVEHWNGTSWTAQTLPAPAGAQGGLLGVACISASACTAVGLAGSPFGTFTVAERWNGTTWTAQAMPPLPGAFDVAPPAIACPTLSLCTAVAGYTNNGPQLTLAEQWNGAPPPPSTSSPSPPAAPKELSYGWGVARPLAELTATCSPHRYLSRPFPARCAARAGVSTR